eukprot:8180855-Alexandrium_andersonii.AAC.1
MSEPCLLAEERKPAPDGTKGLSLRWMSPLHVHKERIASSRPRRRRDAMVDGPIGSWPRALDPF